MTQEVSAATVSTPTVATATAVPVAAVPAPAQAPLVTVTGRPTAVTAPTTSTARAATAARTRKPALVVTAAAKPPVRPVYTAARPLVSREPEPRPRRATTVQVFRVVGCQVALVLGLLAIGRPWPDAVALGAAAAVLVAVSTIRTNDRWLSSSLAGRAGLLLRRTHHDCGHPEHESSALLALLTPDATIRTADVGGSPAAVLSRSEGLVAVLRPRAGSTAFQTTVATGFAGQLVLHAGPARKGPNRVWLALRARRDVDLFDDAELAPVLTNTVRRTLRRLAREGAPAELLSEDDLWTTVVALTHTGSGRGVLREEWRYWRSGQVAQAGFRLTGLDRLRPHDRVPVLDRLLAATPGVAVTASVVTDEPWGAAAVLRVAGATTAAVDVAAAELTYVGERLGVRLERLDGRHAHAVAATLPIGGEPL